MKVSTSAFELFSSARVNNNLSIVSSDKSSNKSDVTNFDSIFSNTTKNIKDNSNEQNYNVTKDNNKNVQINQNTVDKNNIKNTNMNTDKNNINTENIQEDVITKEVISEVEQNIKEIIKEELSLNDEEFEMILCDLGITTLQLLIPENLQQFVLKANNQSDITAMIVNSDILEQFTQISTQLENIDFENDFGITKEQLMNFIQNDANFQQVENNINNENINEENVDEEDINSKNVNSENVNKENIDEKSVNEENIDLKNVNKEDINIDKENVSQKDVNSDLKAEQFEQTNEESSTDTNQQSQTDEKPTLDMNQFINNLAQYKQVSVEEISQQVEVVKQMRQIVEQIVEQVKTNVTSDTATMDMVLHPESLGRVNLSVVMKDGVMTANFVTENQMAKEALESQIMMLKDNLQNQGLKVDKVEVAIADFSFNQNQNTDTNSKEENHNEQTNSRRLNINDINLLDDDDMSEEEALAADIMIKNGNNIDYTA